MSLTNIIFLAEESLADTMGRAGLNTLMGLLIVFFTLTFISLVIALEGKIFTSLSKKKSAPTVVSEKKDETPAPEIVQETADDMEEIAAVIAAAIYAYESETGEPVDPNALVVKSIRRLR